MSEEKTSGQVLDALLKEFEGSGLSVDEFCRKHLSERGIAAPEEKLQQLDAAFGRIEEHYEALQACGVGRRGEYFAGTLTPILEGTSPENAGRVLSRIIQKLTGEKAEFSCDDDKARTDAAGSLKGAWFLRTVSDLQKR